jgi:hypothetical protein
VSGTSLGVNPTPERLRAAHTLSRIRPYPAPDTVAARRATGESVKPAPVVPKAFRPTSQPVTDTLTRVGAMVAMDNQNRIAAGKLAKPLGWSLGTPLLAHCAGDRVSIVSGIQTSPAQIALCLGDDCRLTLPPAAVAVLGLTKNDQVLAIAIPATGELLLRNASVVLAEATGPVTVPATTHPAEAEAEGTDEHAAATATRIRKRWVVPVVA